MASVGERIRAARLKEGWSQKKLASELLRVDPEPSSTLPSLTEKVGAWERGESGISPRYQHLLTTALGRSPADLGFTAWPRSASLGASSAIEEDVAAMRAFRAADQQMGGAHLYAGVRRYLRTEVAPRLVDAGGGHDGRPLFTGAAGLTEMAGWMAHDAGNDDAAREHFERALDLARAGGDSQLGAHVLGSLSHLAHELDQPADAIRLARQGQHVLAGGAPHPGLAARLLAMQARGHAATGRPKACVAALGRAEIALDGPVAYEPSPWVSHFDEGSLASEAARCMRRLGDADEAKRQAERILELRPPGRARSRAFGQLALASALIAMGRPDEACAVATEVVDATESLGSAIVTAQLSALAQSLEPWRTSTTVKDFLECLERTLRQRLLLSRWLTTSEP